MNITAGACCAPALLHAQTSRFSRFTVIDHAQQLAHSAFDAEGDKTPQALGALSYDDYRKIRMRPEARIALGEGFALDLFHRGHLFPHKVAVNFVRDGTPREVPYQPRMFDFGGLRLPTLDRSLGFAGLRIRYPLNRPDVADELCVFLGASYFRFLGRGQRYGTSLRALGLNAGLPGITEEFPFFREFWIEEPEPDTQSLVLHALLDSPSVTGAFRFAFFPGEETHVDVQSTLIPRVTLERPAIAPITSMFLTGEQDRRMKNGFRPEVHDSDGLSIETNVEQTWRPLRNPESAQVNHFPVPDLKSFALQQRDRHFDDYQDLEALYELRPGYVITPSQSFGPGAIILSELPTDSEIHDNIVASFRPENPLEPNRTHEFNYRIATLREPRSKLAYVSRLMVSEARILLDFVGGDLAFWAQALQEVRLVLSSPDLTLHALPAVWNPHVKGLRTGFTLQNPRPEPRLVTAYLEAHGRRLSETLILPLNATGAQELAEERGVR